VSADEIQLRGLRVVAVHGLLAEERERAQPFEVDVDLGVDLAPAGASDDLDDTVDYGGIVGVVTAVMAGPPIGLLEHLAASVAAAVLAADVRISTCAVTVRKLRPPVAADLTSVAVSIRRSR